MKTVRFYDSVPDGLYRYAVIATRCGDKWVFCRHRQRDTYEFPGGHREPGEAILTTARRELYEETCAQANFLMPLCAYSVQDGGTTDDVRHAYSAHNAHDIPNKSNVHDIQDTTSDTSESFGLLCYATIPKGTALQPPDVFEMAQVVLSKTPPGAWTYPDIQPLLLERAKQILQEGAMEDRG